MDGESIRVSIVEDDARVRGSFSRLLDQAAGFSCVSQHSSAEDALDALPAVRPHVILMDINLPGKSGVECIPDLKTLLPDAQIVMLTVYEDTDLIFGALSAGATGYLLKRTPTDELLRGIRDVHRGGSPMTSHIARKVVQFLRQPPPGSAEGALSPREREVLELLASGYIYKEIGDKLGIGIETVRTHVKSICQKMHVRSRLEAVARHRLG